MKMPRILLPLLTILCASVMAPTVWGQGGGGTTNTTNNFVNPIAGVDVDAQGVLRIRQFDPRVAQQRLMAARALIGQDVMVPSKLRKVSLQRLEAAIASQLDSGQPLTNDVLGLAGLSSVQYVFFYPETKDIVIAGPADGFVADPTDRLVGINSSQPVVLLEDLVTALRAFGPGTINKSPISVSIDPTPEGLERMQRFLASVRGPVGARDAEPLAMALKENLGLQTVSIKGIPTDTHFARVLVEADYRMKLIGIGLEKLPVRMMSYVERANPTSVAANAMERWYFQPNYDGISVSDDGLAMKINERGVQLVGANERVAEGGQRVAAPGRGNKASQAFCSDFTKLYPEIAEKVRVYAELRQLIDLSIAAAYIQEQDFYGQADWIMPVMGNEESLAVQTYSAPVQVETAVNAVWKGSTLMTPLGGGVQIQPRLAFNSDRLQVDTSGESVKVKAEAGPSQLTDGQWWWD
jgi:Protein of unknown function (DUF1598)